MSTCFGLSNYRHIGCPCRRICNIVYHNTSVLICIFNLPATFCTYNAVFWYLSSTKFTKLHFFQMNTHNVDSFLPYRLFLFYIRDSLSMPCKFLLNRTVKSIHHPYFYFSIKNLNFLLFHTSGENSISTFPQSASTSYPIQPFIFLPAATLPSSVESALSIIAATE